MDANTVGTPYDTVWQHRSTLEYRSVWKHKRRPITAVVNSIHWSSGDVQVLNHERTHLRWITIKGLIRDYEPTGVIEPVEGASADA
ncbi:hypothetical protein ACWGJ9_11440 [Curtobacterium citreum]